MEVNTSVLQYNPINDGQATGGDLVYRQRLSTRVWHWINVVTFFVMLMSGLMIVNAHPRLYWGQYGANPDPAWLEIGNVGDDGFLRLGSATFTTTGLLGTSRDGADRIRHIAFPSWATIPSTYNLSLARRWHLTFAWVFAVGIALFGLWIAFSGHLRQDLLPRAGELRPGALWTDIKHHAMLRFPKGDAARNYNVLQKLSYLVVIIGLIPLMVLTGLTMSPSLDAT